MFKCTNVWEIMNLISTITYQYIYFGNIIIESLSISVQKMIWDEFDIRYVIR